MTLSKINQINATRKKSKVGLAHNVSWTGQISSTISLFKKLTCLLAAEIL